MFWIRHLALEEGGSIGHLFKGPKCLKVFMFTGKAKVTGLGYKAYDFDTGDFGFASSLLSTVNAGFFKPSSFVIFP